MKTKKEELDLEFWDMMKNGFGVVPFSGRAIRAAELHQWIEDNFVSKEECSEAIDEAELFGMVRGNSTGLRGAQIRTFSMYKNLEELKQKYNLLQNNNEDN